MENTIQRHITMSARKENLCLGKIEDNKQQNILVCDSGETRSRSRQSFHASQTRLRRSDCCHRPRPHAPLAQTCVHVWSGLTLASTKQLVTSAKGTHNEASSLTLNLAMHCGMSQCDCFTRVMVRQPKRSLTATSSARSQAVSVVAFAR